MGKSYKVINEEKGIGISYIPKKPNGVAIIMREPGGDDGSLEGNNDWFIKMLDEKSKAEKNMSTYRNRFLEMVKTASNEPNKVGFNDLKDIYFANIMYNSCGSSLSENYKNLGEEEKENRINLIIDEILKDSKKKGIDLVFGNRNNSASCRSKSYSSKDYVVWWFASRTNCVLCRHTNHWWILYYNI